MSSSELCDQCSAQFCLCDVHSEVRILPNPTKISNAVLDIDGTKYRLTPHSAISAVKRSRAARLTWLSKMMAKLADGLCASLKKCDCAECERIRALYPSGGFGGGDRGCAIKVAEGETLCQCHQGLSEVSTYKLISTINSSVY